MAVASFMFRRPHHQRILRLLEVFNCAILGETGCWFAGGTAGVLMLDEYRESVNVDFLCASTDGYRRLRELVTEQGLGELLTGPVRYARRDMPVRADRYGIRTFIEIDGAAINAWRRWPWIRRWATSSWPRSIGSAPHDKDAVGSSDRLDPPVSPAASAESGFACKQQQRKRRRLT